jgi:hypothetical protein
VDTQTNSKIIELNNGDLKLINTDLKHKTVSVNNLDNTSWLIFKLDGNKDETINDLQILDLSNYQSDNKHIFLLYSTYRREIMPIEDFSEVFNRKFTLKIINTNGDILLKVNKVTDYKILGNYPNQKLMIRKIKKQGFKTTRHLEIYNLNFNSIEL